MIEEFEKCTINDQAGGLAEGNFIHCSFYRCKFQGVDLTHRGFIDSAFHDSLLTQTSMSAVRLQHTAFVGCKIVGVDFTDCGKTLFSPTFHQCRLIGCLFAGISAKQTAFTECFIEECNFEEANLQGVSMRKSNLKGTTFRKTDLRGADFTEALDYQIDPQENKIKGCKFSMPEVLSLLEPFEVVIQ